MKQPHRIFITLEGGLIQDIEGIPEGIEIVKMDFDIEGADEEDITAWKPFGRDKEEEACISTWNGKENREQGETQETLNSKYRELIPQLPK